MYYALVGVSELEISNEKSLVIYISECQHRCNGCHTPYMHERYGDLLKGNFNNIYELYKNYITCVCFLGEGREDENSRKEFREYCNIIHKDNIKTALYSGRNCKIEKWMTIFDYIKIGSYNKELGTLYSKNTNQRLYKKVNKNKYENITYFFWK